MIVQSFEISVGAGNTASLQQSLIESNYRFIESVLYDNQKDYDILIQEVGGNQRTIAKLKAKSNYSGETVLQELLRTNNVTISVTNNTAGTITAYVGLKLKPIK